LSGFLYLRLDNDCKIAVKSFVNTSPGLFHNHCILQFVGIVMKQIENAKKNINVILSMTRTNHFFIFKTDFNVIVYSAEINIG
jgi:hypothetical protein